MILDTFKVSPVEFWFPLLFSSKLLLLIPVGFLIFVIFCTLVCLMQRLIWNVKGRGRNKKARRIKRLNFYLVEVNLEQFLLSQKSACLLLVVFLFLFKRNLLMSVYELWDIVIVFLYWGVSAVAAGGLPSAPTPVDNIVRDGRQNKKSKWDKVLTCLCSSITNKITVISIYWLSHCFI